MAKITIPELNPQQIEARLGSIAQQVVSIVANEKAAKHDNAFETALDEFGLSYGISKILDKVKQQVVIVRDGQANTQGDVLTVLVDDVIGYALLLRDYINRNPHLVASINEVATSVADGDKKVEQGIDNTITEAATLLMPVVEETADQSFAPEIPQTVEGTDPNYNAR